MSAVRLIIFAKAPQPGLAKTRLIPALGAEGAAALARRMLDATLHSAQAAGIGVVELCLTPAPADPAWQGHSWPATVELSDQGAGDLGERMARAVRRGIAQGTPVLLIGTDCPQLSPAALREAALALDEHDCVLYPASDGGYVLLGLKQDQPRVFADIHWSSASVAASTRAHIAELGWRLHEGAPLHDIDTPQDLSRLPPGWLAS